MHLIYSTYYLKLIPHVNICNIIMYTLYTILYTILLHNLLYCILGKLIDIKFSFHCVTFMDL